MNIFVLLFLYSVGIAIVGVLIFRCKLQRLCTQDDD